jgi:Ca-activated chloride channel family protein
VKAHLVSPASAAFIELGNSESQTRTGQPLVGKTENLVLSPVVIAMWRPMAEALGWGKRPIGWSDVLEMARSQEGWSKYGYPQWGQFKFGHTHPEYSNSGLISVLAEAYAGAGKVSGLTLQDVQRPEVSQFLTQIERAVVHYGSSTGFFGRKMFDHGPEYLSAAVLYENMIIESYGDVHSKLPFPVVAVYPKEGTFWSDHPVGIVERPWLSGAHRQACEKYIQFLTDTPQQRRAMEFGFRPADVTLPLASPIDPQHGVDPLQPETTLQVPSAPVMAAVIELWKQCKKHANLVLVLDVSGSMSGEKLTAAKHGAAQLIELLGDQDQLTLLPFNDHVVFAGKNLLIGTQREEARRSVQSCFAGGGTALYDAVAAAQQHLDQQPDSDMISAMVVLSDGADTNSAIQLSQLLDMIRSDSELRSTRVFTIGYGQEANQQVLQQIAEATQAKYFAGTAETIREVFKEISTFF